MKRILTIIAILFCWSLQAQYDKVWIFGSSSSNRSSVLGGLNFNNTPPKPFTFPIEQIASIFGETTASISDKAGNLLFATDGYHIWDKSGKLMPNGRGVNFSVISLTGFGSASQGSLIVKVPCEEHLYYVFAVGQIELASSGAFGDLHYSLVDMSLNNGLGDVVVEKSSILLNKGYTEHMTVVQGKGNYLWLLALGARSNNRGLHAYKISIRGIDTVPVVSSIGSISTSGVGWLVGNNRVNKLALADMSTGRLSWMDFDNETGKANEMELFLGVFPGSYGVCFSPNDSLLYLTSAEGAVQYEVYNNFNKYVVTDKTFFTAIQKGPDNKLYFLSTAQELSTIAYPNRVGAACGLELNAIKYNDPIRFNGGLPNTIGVFKSEKRISTVAQHTIEKVICGNAITLSTTDSIADKTTLWSTGEWGATIRVNKSGIYVAHTFSTSECIEHVDSYFVNILEPIIDLNIQTACPNVDNGKIELKINNLNPSYIKGVTWYNQIRDQIIGIGDTLTGLKGGIYWARISYTHCDTFLQIEVPGLEDRIAFEVDSLVCVSSTINVNNTTSENYTSFWWFKDTVNVGNTRELSFVVEDTGKTELMLVGQIAHCYDTLVKYIQVDPSLAVRIHADPLVACVGEKIQIAADSHFSITAYDWKMGKHQFSGKESNYSISMDAAGEYVMHLKTKFRICPDTNTTVKITIYANPEVYLGNDSSLCYQGKAITLQNNINQPTNTNYLWSTGETTNRIQVTSPGIYSLTQRSEPIGCTGYGSIEIAKDCFVDIPNAFTPNGDGVNDYFFPRKWLSNGVEKFHLQIFNRWGQLIFETHQLDGLGWDGKWNGQQQSMGVYLYRIELFFKNGTQESYEGNLTLIR